MPAMHNRHWLSSSIYSLPERAPRHLSLSRLSSGFATKPDDVPDFERCNDGFDPRSGSGVVEIWGHRHVNGHLTEFGPRSA
jgi:hypothetical protein